ncbi:hypothetical protein JCGZ_16229 [Jatropha curcas]|uniref:Uncharacterized protein n=1 Tax=Jatropha curcas TaxID=180498 RepID=A0A067K6M3_JATCU|nr:hypothetical protein JCGZ_16229 [Jatropha curcas]
MEPFISYVMHFWTKKLEKVEKINLSRYGMASSVTLRGLSIDRSFMDACQAFVGSTGSSLSDWSGFFRTLRMLGLSVEEARELIVDDQANLAMLIERYLDPLDFVD